MLSQIFKTSPPIELLFELLNDIAVRKQNKYILSKTVFKKGRLEKKIEPFINKIKPHYFKSKKYYSERAILYKNFITIIRQICKYHGVGLISEIKYSKSKYDINYNIFIPKQLIKA